MSSPVAANEINSAEKCQTLEAEQSSQSTGLNVCKIALTVMPLSHRKQTSAGVKRKADNNDGESSYKCGRYLSTEILEPDILIVDTNTNVAKKTQSCENKMPVSLEGSDVQKYDHYLHDLIKSCSFSQVIKLLEDNHCFSQDTLDKALILACQSGHKHTVEKLIDHGANICCRDPDGNTPLIISSKKQFVELVKFLLTREADVNAANSAGDTALILSIQSTRSTAITTLLLQQKEIDIGPRNEQGYTALMKAVELFEFSTAQILLKLHFQKHSKMSDPWWELHNSAFKNYKGETTADMMRKHGHCRIFRVCIKYLQDEMWHEKDVLPPLFRALKDCDVKLLDTVLDQCSLDVQANVKMVNCAYSLFFQNSFSQITESAISVVKRLLELGADVNGGPSVFPVCVATKAGSYPLVELLCQHSADCNKADRMFGCPPLSIATEEGRYDLIELLLNFGANIHDTEIHYSPVDQAFIRGHTNCAKLLVQHSAKVNFGNALHNIIHNQNMNYMNFLLENCRHETHQYILENKHHLLKSAVREANVEIVSHILHVGFDIAREFPCLEKYVTQSGNGKIVRFLIQRGADINKMVETTCGNYTPLYLVLSRDDLCRLSQLQIVQALLENGASPNIHDNTSPLMLAALTNSSIDLLQLLLDYGADIHWRDEEGDTAFSYSVYQGYHSNAEFLIRCVKDKDFLKAQNNDGLTALMQAARYSNAAVVTEVINNSPDLNVTDHNGNTALLHAINRIIVDGCQYGVEEIVAALVNAGCDVNWQNNDGLSPLMLATNRFGEIDTKILLDAGATNRFNKTVIKVIKILLDAGADVNAVSKTDMTKTALSYFQPMKYVTNEDVPACLSHFLSRGACLSYLQAKMFHRIFLCNKIDIISKVITCRSAPISIRSDVYFKYFIHTSHIFDVSPLCTALFGGQMSLARHFIEIMFLTRFDVSALMYNETVRFYLNRHHLRQCLELLDEMSSQPMSLFRLAFVTVSSAVGTTPGRENRVSKLPLPQILKDKLLFKSLVDWRTPIDTIRSWQLPFDPDPKTIIRLHDGCKHCWVWRSLKCKPQPRIDY